jgi:hypothetical protein
MLQGFVPFPPEFAADYRAKGYWRDQSLAQEFDAVFKRYSDRVALVDGKRTYTYADLDRITDNLALNLLELGLKPQDRVVPTLPNVAEFVILYFALQKLGAIPIAALVTHRYLEISQFVNLSQATACVYPETQGDFAFAPVIDRVQAEHASLKFRIVLGKAGKGEHSLVDLIEKPATLKRSELEKIGIDLNELFAKHRMPPPAVMLQTHSALSVIVALSSCDLLAILPAQWNEFPLTRDVLQVINIKEKLPAPDIVMIRRPDLPLTPAADFFCDLMKRYLPV